MRPDFVFVPYLEHLDHAIAALGSPFGGISWSGIVMKCAFHHTATGVSRPSRRTDWVKRLSFFRLLRMSGLKCLFTIDPTLVTYELLHKAYAGRRPASTVHYVGDPHDIHGVGSRDEVRSALGIKPNAIVLLVYGDFTVSASRKGVDALLAATRDTAFPQQVVLLVAGAQVAASRRVAGRLGGGGLRSSGRLLELNRYLSRRRSTRFSPPLT